MRKAAQPIQHAELGQPGDPANVRRTRGGYREGWTRFWITAHVLNTAGELEAMRGAVEQLQ